MPFEHPRAIAAWRTIESMPDGISLVLVIETDLSLNPRSGDYDSKAINDLMETAKAYTASNPHLDQFRIISLDNEADYGAPSAPPAPI